MVSRFDHSRLLRSIAAAALLAAQVGPVSAASPTNGVGHATSTPSAPTTPSKPRAQKPANDYPTYARVQYVDQCMARSGGSEAELYQCSCAIDRIAARLSYDQFVEASTYAHYATLGGENGGIFRDHALAQQQAKLMRSIESAAWHACGLRPPAH